MNEPTHGGRIRSNETGRNQLKGVLEGLVQQSKEEREFPESVVVDNDVEEGARDLLELPHFRGELGRKRVRTHSPPSARRKTMRRTYKDIIPSSEGSESGDTDAGDRHIPYVMTLFDRKVDIARFTEGTTLYVMCREWMKNNLDPEGDLLANGSKDKSHEHDQFDFGVYRLPSPLPLIRQESQPLKISAVYSSRDIPWEEDLQVLREQNIKKWTDTRARWKQASLVNQQRYAASIKIIRELYER
eukprot:Em0047g4a